MHNSFTWLDLQHKTTMGTYMRQILRSQWPRNLFLTSHLSVIVHLSLSQRWWTTVILHNTSRHDIMAPQEGCIVWCDHKQKDLYQLILLLKPKEKVNKTDALLAHLLPQVWPNRVCKGKNYETCAWKQCHSRYEAPEITTRY